MRIADVAVRPRIMAALAIPLAMMAGLSVVALTSLNRITATQAWVEHTYNVLTQSETIVANAVDMETGMRGFLLAGEDEFLEPYDRGGSRIGELFATLQKTVDDNPPQVRKLEEAEAVIAEWRREITEPMIAMRRSVGQGVTMDDVAALVAEARGKTYFDAFRALMNEFAAEERALMELRQAENASTYRLALTLIIGGMAAAIAISAAFGWWIGAGIVNPIKAITGAMSALAAGEKSTDIPGADRGDELGRMAAAVEVFKTNMLEADALAMRQAEEAEAKKARASQIDSLTTSFDDSVTALLDALDQAAGDMKSTANAMSTVADDANDRAETVASAADRASTNVQTVASATEELASSIQEIGRRIAQSAEIAKRAVAEADKANAQVRGLAESANRIGDVVKLISDIAEQTNLLALNATIEAARAGEAGRGFAVVASEVKSLATQTAQATDEIAQQIQTVQTETGAAVDGIQSISAVIGEIDETATAVAAAIEEQGSATKEIARNVQEAAEGAQDVSTNVVDMTSAAKQTEMAADQVTTLAGTLDERARALKSEVVHFLTGVRAA